MMENDLPPQKPEPEEGEQKTMDDLVASLQTDLRSGLTSASAADRLRRLGPNEVPEKKTHPFLLVAKKFWGLTAWMLELIIVLSLVLRKYPDAAIVAVLLVTNAVVSSAGRAEGRRRGRGPEKRAPDQRPGAQGRSLDDRSRAGTRPGRHRPSPGRGRCPGRRPRSRTARSRRTNPP